MGVVSLNVGIAPAYNPPAPPPAPAPPPPSIQNITPPSFSSPLTFGVANNFNPGVWQGSIAANRSWIFLLVPVTAQSTNYTGGAPNTIAVHTPRAPAAVGNQLVIRETVYALDGVTVAGTVDSAPTTIVAQVIPLAITTVLDPVDLFINQPVPSNSPVSINGGQAPYTITTPALTSTAPGVSMVASTGALTGTPLGPVVGSTLLTTQVMDSLGNGPVSTQWHVTVSNSGVTPIPALTIVGVAAVEANGLDFTPYQGVTITGASVNGSTARLTRFPAGVLSTGLDGYLRRFCLGDPISSGSGLRCENSRDDQNLVANVEYWWSFAIFPNAGEWYSSIESGASPYVIWQVHQKDPNALPGPTMGFAFNPATGRCYMSLVSGALPNGDEVNADGGVGPTIGAWTRYVINARFGNASQGQSPFLNIWRNGVQVVTNNTSNIGQIGDTHYTRIGFYRWHFASSDFGSLSAVSAYYSPPFFQAGSNLLAQALASVQGYA